MLLFVHGVSHLRLSGAFLGALFLFSSFSAQAQNPEFRALWVDAWGDGFLNSSQTTQLITDARAYNFNAVIVQMRRRGDALYTPLAGNDPKSTAVSPGYDALADLISKAHSGTPRIEVHCWVPAHVIWSADTVPSQPGHVYNLHPEYLMKNSSGTNWISEGYYLDPGHPEAARWNFTMATNIVRSYDIDGFHWDYIRYPQQDSGYNDTAIARYNAEFGLAGKPAYDNSQFSTWRRRQVTDFLRWTDSEMLGIKSNLIISAAVFGSRSDAYTYRFQDWAAWNTEGLMDLCIPMIYSADNSVFTSRANDAYNNQGIRRVYPGPGAYLNTKENTLWQLNYSRNKPFYGTSFYCYRVPNSGDLDQAGTFAYIEANYQPSWVATPSLPWKVSPTKGIVKGYVIRSDNGLPVYNATVRIGTRTVKSEAHGHYAFFEAQTGTYNVTATAAGQGGATNSVTVVAGAVATANLVLPVTDTTAPVISSVVAANITQNSARIAWFTDDASQSVVDYGLSAAYGNSITDSALVTDHAVLLTGLDPNTTYHHRVRSTNYQGLSSTSGDLTFTTASLPAPYFIVESYQADGNLTPAPAYSDAGFPGSSTTKSTAAGLVATKSRYSTGGSGIPWCQFQPTLPYAGGTYDVYSTHGGASASPDIVATISQTGCTGLPGTTAVFGSSGVNTWAYVGRMVLNSGVSAPVVRFTYLSGTTNGSSRMYGDAAKFVYVPPPAPEIVADPQDQAVKRGSPVTFTVSASGQSLAYQWRFEGSNLPSANGSTYTIQSAQPSHEGQYDVVVTNFSGNPVSAPAMLTVLVPPDISSHPQSRAVAAGSDVLFSVGASGSDPLHYQWLFNGAPISEAAGPDYTRQNAVNTDQGAYRVVVTNIVGAVTSSPAALTVTYAVPPLFVAASNVPGEKVVLQITGGPGQFKVQTSSDLTNWIDTATIQATNSDFSFEDETGTNARNFYRVKRDP